jgi:integrase
MAGWIVHRADRPKPYLARFQPKGGRAVSKSFRTKRDADKWLEVQSVDKTRGEWVDPRRGELTLREWSERWLAGRRVRPATQSRDESVIRKLILPHLGDRRLNSITPDELREWVADLEAAGKAPATVAKAYQIAAAMIRLAIDDGRLARSPLPRRVGLPTPNREPMRFLTLAEVHHLADVIDPRYRVLVLAAGYTGLRFGELAGLRTDTVDLLRRAVTVTATLSDVKGRVELREPKTPRSRRRVAISPNLADELATHIGKFGSDGWVFTSPTGDPIRRTNFRRRAWIPATETAGLDGVRFHDLRHTHAAALIAQGEHPKLISERLGHSSIRVTFDVYGHLMPGMDADAADRMDDGWDAAARESRTIRAPSPITDIGRTAENPR